jgi:stringent starvation protein B
MDTHPEKKEKLLAALDRGMVMIHLDARRPGVAVPAQFRDEAHLRLNLSYRFDPPDLSVSEWGVRSTLSFGGSRFTVAVPWSALFAITSHVTKEFWMYPDDMPQELLSQSAPQPDGSLEEVPPARPRAVLREIPGAREDDPPSRPPVEPSVAEAPPGEDDPPRPRGRGHLRLVK